MTKEEGDELLRLSKKYLSILLKNVKDLYIDSLKGTNKKEERKSEEKIQRKIEEIRKERKTKEGKGKKK